MSFEQSLTKSWYRKCGWTWGLTPFLLLTAPIVHAKRKAFLKHRDTASYRSKLPVIVVGNITVGGTGKSPMVIALCSYLKEQGYRPGIVTRGHKRELDTALLVTPQSTASEVGDEPLMLARRTGCPVSVANKRVLAIRALENDSDVDVIISDDGMQHYAMDRDIEIIMVDAKRGLGNGQLLPVGPLREPVSRIDAADCVFSLNALPALVTKQPMFTGTMELTQLKHVIDDRQQVLSALAHDGWHVVAGVGNPERFMETLKGLGLSDQSHTTFFSDHHQFKRDDIAGFEKVIMTEKDAVKVEAFAQSQDDWWYVVAELSLPENFKQFVLGRLAQVTELKSLRYE